MKWELICRMNIHRSIKNTIYKNLHYCRTRGTQNDKNLCTECVVNLVHILRLFPHHPRGKSHWRIVFFLSGCSPIGISFHLNNYFWCFDDETSIHLRMKKRWCRFYLLADLKDWRLLQLMMKDDNLSHLI